MSDVNLTGVKQSQGVWLVKVPKYLSQQWDKAADKGEVGKISIGKKQGKTEVRFTLNEELTALGAVGEKDSSLQVPRDHPFTMHTVGGQTMAVFSQSDTDEISLEGMVVHRAECRPVVNDNYMKLKKAKTYLKEIMKDIGTYNNKGAHKSTWELKPEYRHYESGEEEEEMQTA
ncbi:general transcription factor IIF subunit 2-like [Morone saxatilis]|uniref:general transcription factor IIF subunit 2-like n=1 Tax=Morone saxatilis TaxID=34816 RepID=UPI0015E219D9|nr:general transcription factor IIF subunit 2-like [Morone saxatilis]